MKIAILYDVDGWAYHAEAKGMSKFMKRYGINCTLYKYPDFYNSLTKTERNKYDGVWLFPRQASPITFPANKTIVKFSSFGSFSNQAQLNSIDFKYMVCTNRMIMKKATEDLPSSNIIYMPLCIDNEVFFHKKNINNIGNKIVVGFAGNAERPGKGFDLILDAIKKLNDKVVFKSATFHKNKISYENMPDFYRQLDLLICMSTAEGGPLTSFEAGLCGTPTISGCQKSAINEATINNYNSFHIERTSEDLVNKILELSKNKEKILSAKKNIAETMYFGHSWDAQARAYSRLLETLKP